MQASGKTTSPESGVKQCSHVLSATSAFSTDDMLMRTRVQVIARRPKVENALGQ